MNIKNVTSKYYSLKHLLLDLFGIGGLWMLAYAGLIVVLPALGIGISYHTAPLLAAAYYAGWSAVALFFFPKTLAKVHLEQSRSAYVFLACFISVVAIFYAAVLPALSGYGTITGGSENSFLAATPMFFLPKMAELVFQQILIAALILSVASFYDNVFFVSMLYMLVFGVTHTILLLELPAAFVGIFALGALLSALLFPYLILRVRNGFVYSFVLQWVFYVVLTVIFLA